MLSLLLLSLLRSQESLLTSNQVGQAFITCISLIRTFSWRTDFRQSFACFLSALGGNDSSTSGNASLQHRLAHSLFHLLVEVGEAWVFVEAQLRGHINKVLRSSSSQLRWKFRRDSLG